MDNKELRRVWNQHEIPVILRLTGKGQLLRMRLSYADSNRTWLQDGRRISPTWTTSKRYWEIPEAWFNDVEERAQDLPADLRDPTLSGAGEVFARAPQRFRSRMSVLMHGTESWRGKRRELVRNLRDLRHALGRTDARLWADEATA